MMSRVQKIELFHVEVPLEESLFPSWYRGYKLDKQNMTLLRLTTNDGHQGVSAGWSLGREKEGLKDWLPGMLLGLEANDIDTVRQRLKERARWGWNNHWIETAFWDLCAKIEGKPLYQMFMESPQTVESVNVYASTQEVLDVEARLSSLDALAATNVNALGLRLSGDMDSDLELVRRVREAVGQDMMLLLDAGQCNRAWTGDNEIPKWKLSSALDFAAAVEPYRIEWLENPLGMYAYGDLSVLRSESAIPVAGGRLNQGWHEYKVLIDQGSCDIFRPDATVSGGVKTALQVMDACLRRDLYFSPYCGHNSFSFLINLHLYAACPRKFVFEYSWEPGKWGPEQRDTILKAPLALNADGTLPVPQEPGLGANIDEAALQQFGTQWLEVEA